MASSSKIVTVNICTYQRPTLLRRAILSILNQTYPEFQIAVYDNASSDSTRSVVDEMIGKDSRISYFCHERNIGYLQNHQFAMDRVTTPFFCFLSDDDVLLPEFLKTTVKSIEKYPEAAFSAGICLGINEEGGILGYNPFRWKRSGYILPPHGLFEFFKKNMSRILIFNSVLFRREITQQVGKFDAAIGLPTDTEYLVRLISRYPFVFNKKPFALFVVHKGNSVHRKTDLAIYFGCYNILKRFAEDEEISLEVREKTVKLFLTQLRSLLVNLWLNAFMQNRIKECLLISEIIRDNHGSKKLPNILDAWIHWTNKSRFLTKAAKLLHLNYQKLKRTLLFFQFRFGKYSKYLRHP